MKPILLMQTGSAPAFIRERHGDYDAMFFTAGGLDPAATVVVHVQAGEALPDHTRFRGVVVTGSHSMVTDRQAWSEAAALWLRDAVEDGMPVFGVCYGHQLLAHALGGTIDYLFGGQEIGCLKVRLNAEAAGHALLAGLPAVFRASLSHSQHVATLPGGAVSLARSDRDANQIIAYRPGVYSVQFHPEFTAAVTLSHLEMAMSDGEIGGADHKRLRAEVTEMSEAGGLLQAFVSRLP